MGFDLECSRCEFVWADESDTAQPPEACPVCGSRLVPRKADAELDFGPREPSSLTQTGELLALASFACFFAFALAALIEGPLRDLLTSVIPFVGLALGLAALIVAFVGESKARGFSKKSPARKKAARALVLSALAFITWALPIAMWLCVVLRSDHLHRGTFGD